MNKQRILQYLKHPNKSLAKEAYKRFLWFLRESKVEELLKDQFLKLKDIEDPQEKLDEATKKLLFMLHEDIFLVSFGIALMHITVHKLTAGKYKQFNKIVNYLDKSLNKLSKTIIEKLIVKLENNTQSITIVDTAFKQFLDKLSNTFLYLAALITIVIRNVQNVYIKICSQFGLRACSLRWQKLLDEVISNYTGFYKVVLLKTLTLALLVWQQDFKIRFLKLIPMQILKYLTVMLISKVRKFPAEIRLLLPLIAIYIEIRIINSLAFITNYSGGQE